MSSFSFLLLATSLSGLAQASPEPPPQDLTQRERVAASKSDAVSDERVLGGHHFLPTAIVDWPFVTTHFVFVVGLGYASGPVPVDDGFGGVDELSLDVAAFTNALEFQVSVADFLALRLNAAGRAFGGTNDDAALNFGASFDVALGGGATASWKLGDRFQVGAVLDVQAGPAYNLNVLNAVNRSLETGTVNLGNGLTQGTSTSVSSGAVGAVGLHPAVGLFARTGYEHAIDSFGGETTDQGSFTGGGGLSVDLHAVTPAPVGLLVAYSALVPFDGPGTTHSGAVGLYYTGRSSLALGLEASMFVEPFIADRDLTTYQGIFGMQYFW